MPTMKEVKLPGPEGRVVVFGGTVFKLKYKLSSMNIKEVPFSGRMPSIQQDIKELTTAILDRICTSGVTSALRTDQVVIFLELLPWDRVNRLEFGYSNCMLTPYPNMIFMLVRVLSSDSHAPPTSPNSMLGKHKLDPPLPPPVLELEEENVQALQSSGSDETAAHDHPQKRPKVHCSDDTISTSEGKESLVDATLPQEGARCDDDEQASVADLQSKVESECVPSPSVSKHQSKPLVHPPANTFYHRVISMVRRTFGW